MTMGWGGRSHTVLRPMNGDLVEGMTDGMYKKNAMNRGGVVEHTSEDAREDLSEYYHVQALVHPSPPVEPFVKMRVG